MILIWSSTLWLLFRGTADPSMRNWSRAIAFKPSEAMAPEQLFHCLLSGNLALMMRDNFNQLGSALPERRARRMLSLLWQISSSSDCHWHLERRLQWLGQMTNSEKRAVTAWIGSSALDSREYEALKKTCIFLSSHLSTSPTRIRHVHLGVRAWDIQQLAYALRLSLTAGYISRDVAEETLRLLATHARSHYASWKDYSLAALIGLGMRGSIEFDSTEWVIFARTHRVLLHELHSPIRNASAWRDLRETEIPSERQSLLSPLTTAA